MQFPPRMSKDRSKTAIAVAIAVLLIAILTLLIRQHYILPYKSHRLANHTLQTLVELRKNTGRLPLRYITQFEHADTIRSPFDTRDPTAEKLIENLRSAINIAPEPKAMLILGLLLIDIGKIDEAEKLLQIAQEAHPNCVSPLNGLAVILFERAKYKGQDSYKLLQKGLALLRQAESLNPEDLRVLFNYGKFYEALNMPVAAELSWARYLTKDADSDWSTKASLELTQ